MGHAELQLDWYDLTLRVIAARISEERGIVIDSDKVGFAIAELHDFPQNMQVFWYVLDNGLKIYGELKDFSFPTVLGGIELLEEECIYPKGIPTNLYEKQVKISGQKWELHRNDPDPFPSNPHAHNYETGLKLDLSNGKLYKKRKIWDALGKKELLMVRSKFEQAGFTMPTLVL